MEINVSPCPEYEVRASDQALMEAFELLMARGRKIRLANQTNQILCQSVSENEVDPRSTATYEQP